jgi:anti-anti-sigma regulatory factor
MANIPSFEHWDGTATGGILTTISPGRTIVRLEGDIDLSMAEEFGLLLLSLPTDTKEIVLDVRALTFCDSTLVNFVAAVEADLPVTVAPPNRWVVELLRLVGLDERVRIADGV